MGLELTPRKQHGERLQHGIGQYGPETSQKTLGLLGCYSLKHALDPVDGSQSAHLYKHCDKMVAIGQRLLRVYAALGFLWRMHHQRRSLVVKVCQHNLSDLTHHELLIKYQPHVASC